MNPVPARSFADQLVRRNAKHRFTFSLLSNSQKGKNNFTLFFGEPSCRVPRQRQICDQGYIRWIFTQNLEDSFADSLVLSWLFCSDFPSVHYLVTIYGSSAIVQLLTLAFQSHCDSPRCAISRHPLCNKNLAVNLKRVIYLATATFLAFANNTVWLTL
ncbi:uncharacterized protein LOC125520078 isoform X1 [Triticum urartu]|uniref:uncharacterized protein LOC125519988 isoform X1 n=1 Tax=Triticum urartu TaxID=4572 RepID=UPI0020443D6D|nr:uncharacterized protein LOC125519988 isoform X1 [Triticum urartu]XP_048540834.1 uncharacterized protein LOC125520078 isoform X1 [Triticum urartu]